MKRLSKLLENEDFKKIMKHLKAFLFPRRCAVCDELMDFGDFSPGCRECIEKAEKFLVDGKLPPSKNCDGGIFTFVFEDNIIREMILSFKELPTENLQNFFAGYLAKAIAKSSLYPAIDIITYVPRSKERLRTIGYDQSFFLAKEIARQLNIPFEKLLIRTGKSVPQKNLSSAERKINVKNAFKLNEKFSVSGKNILLVDDVYTTGTTCGECRRILKKNGAQFVFFASIAH